MKKDKFYQKSWFIIFMLIAFAPIGVILMYCFTSWDKKHKKIITAVCAVWFIFMFVSGTFKTPEKTPVSAPSASQNEQKNEDNYVDPNKVDSNNYLELIAKQLSVQPNDISVNDLYTNAQPNGLTETSGTYKKDGIVHDFTARFVTSTGEAVRLTIDGEKIFWNEDLQDKIADEHSKYKSK